MKKLITLLITLVFIIGSYKFTTSIIENYSTKPRLEQMAKNAFEGGCLNGSRISCSNANNESLKNKCLQIAIEDCPIEANNYKKWLHEGKK